MRKRNETSLKKVQISDRAVVVMGFYAILAAGLSLVWQGELLSLFFILASGAIFLWSFFSPIPSFFALLLFRTAFDSLGSQQSLFSIGPLNVSFTFIAGIIPIILAAWQFIKHPLTKDQKKIFSPWLLFLGLTIALSLLFSFDRSASLVNLFRLLSFFAIFVYSYFIFDTPKKLTSLARALIFTAIIPASVAWYQLATRGGFYDGEQWRLVGTFTHPNMLAIYLVLAISLTLFVALNLRKEAVQRIPYTILGFFFVIPLIFTYTRIAWLALAGILFVVGIVRFRRLLVAAALVFLMFYIFVPFFQERVNTLSSVGVTDSSSWRLDLWRDITGYVKKSPWVGYGPGTASVFLGKNIPRLMMDTEPHNDYLRMLLEGGVLLFISYLWIYWDFLKRLYRGFRFETRPRLKMLIFFIGVFTLSILGASLTDNVIKDAVMQWNFWALAGSLLAVIGAVYHQKKTTKKSL